MNAPPKKPPPGSCVVIDGPNVCMSYHGYRAGAKLKGLQIALEFFAAKRWPEAAILAVFPQSWQSPQLTKLCGERIRYAPQVLTREDDDLFCFQVARERNALLLTNDQFRNHTHRWGANYGAKDTQALLEWLGDHLLSYIFDRETFVPHPERLLRAQKALSSAAPFFHCTNCGQVLVSSDEIISSRDSAGVFQSEQRRNLHGSVFTFLKVRKIQPGAAQEHFLFPDTGARQESEPRLKDTWFPDYAWSLLQCSKCVSHLGWKFRLVRDPSKEQPLYDLLVPEFFGLVHERLTAAEAPSPSGARAAVRINAEPIAPPPKPPAAAPPPKVESTKKCTACAKIRPRSFFVRKQWSSSSGKCKECLGLGAPDVDC